MKIAATPAITLLTLHWLRAIIRSYARCVSEDSKTCNDWASWDACRAGSCSSRTDELAPAGIKHLIFFIIHHLLLTNFAADRATIRKGDLTSAP